MNTRKGKKGQIAIMLAMSFTLLLLLVAMVINISFLVTAKINLQNATDLAAYAGAAQQARYLTEIGKWNYEMRRNYKAMVFDYLITYNAERKDSDFYNYINNISASGTPQDMEPTACATLQRSTPTSSPNPAQEENTCSKIPYDEFEAAINQANAAAQQSLQAALDACTGGGDPTACNIWKAQADQILNSYHGIQSTAADYSGKYANYVDPLYNYNLRLMGWTLHAYRHMQTRIRGIHYGSIKLADKLKYNTADTTVTVFLNSPISIAAKVINGFTDTGPVVKLTAQQGLIELTSQKDGSVSNPVHNAAYTTFRNNLLKVLSSTNARLFHIVPSTPAAGGFKAEDMASGCSSANPRCDEYSGAYLRLQQHDVNFGLNYIKIIHPLQGGGQLRPAQKLVTKFPVGVLKDNRVWTYYAVVGVADTKQIPFKVFFGDSPDSQEPLLIAVAAARPFGSRIGPYIDANCEDMLATNTKCEENGRDPLYTNKIPTKAPNFSVIEKQKDPKNLGVKLTVDKIEYNIPTTGTMIPQPTNNANRKVDLFAKTYGVNSRSRYYTRPGNYKRDDGFDYDSSESDFYEKTDIPPQGNRNSIFAWNATYAPTAPNGTPDEKNDFEAYLASAGPVIHKFTSDSTRQYGGTSSQYRVYVFRYPTHNGSGSDWTIDALTKKPYPDAMEKAFANTMAVNEFEIKRYIIPYTPGTQDHLNYITTNNKNAYIYAGEANRDVETGSPSKQFGDNAGEPTHPKMENPDVLSSSGIFPESYTAWRIGSRGYRVKLTNIQDLLASGDNGNANPLSNPLPDTVTIPGLNIIVDLKKINY